MRKSTTAIFVLRQALSRELRKSAQARFIHRLHCVLLVAGGASGGAVGSIFGRSARSVERWAKAFDHRGLDALRDATHAGRPPRLTASDIVALGADVREGPVSREGHKGTWSGDLLARHVAQRYGVQLSTRQCQRLLRQLRTPSDNAR